MKSLAIGRDDFKHIIENDSYYIDKTKFIEEILKDVYYGAAERIQQEAKRWAGVTRND